MLPLIVATIFSTTVQTAPTIDLPAGTMICATDTAAREYVEARSKGDEHRLHWLSGSVCHSLAIHFRNQTVLGEDDVIVKIEWAYGRDRKTRYVIRG